MNNNGELYAVIERQCLWTKDVKTGTRVLMREPDGANVVKVRVF